MTALGPVRRAFAARYGDVAGAPRFFRAPGRVNLIGEHTDYNGGYVLPMAIDRETVVAAAPRADRRVRACSLNQDQEVAFDLDRPGPPQRGQWIDYLEGVAQALEGRGFRLRGADLVISSDVPAGAGLSSSAALEIATGLALTTISGHELDRVTLALAGQQAEHTYVGTLCGIMDQFIAALGRAGHALLIDCRTLDATPVPLDTTGMLVVICDTNIKHELSSTAYNARRAECEQGVALLREVMPGITQLRDVSLEDFAQHAERLPDPVRRRCRHVVTENDRTLRAAAALSRHDLGEMGRLMNESHISLRDDYEVSCRELDLLAEYAWAFGRDKVPGARMTGGGFGGSTVNLVRRDALDEFRQMVISRYERERGLTPNIHVSAAGDGAREIRDEE